MFGLDVWILKSVKNATPVSGPFGCFCHFYTGHQQEADAPALNFFASKTLVRLRSLRDSAEPTSLGVHYDGSV